MTDLYPFLEKLITTSGLSGHERPVQKVIEEAWKPITDELSTSPLGSLHGLKRGSGKEPRPSILVATHMDAIGLMVSGIRDGFLHIISIGGIDPRVLPGQLVTVHGRENLPGVIVQPTDDPNLHIGVGVSFPISNDDHFDSQVTVSVFRHF